LCEQQTHQHSGRASQGGTDQKDDNDNSVHVYSHKGSRLDILGRSTHSLADFGLFDQYRQEPHEQKGDGNDQNPHERKNSGADVQYADVFRNQRSNVKHTDFGPLVGQYEVL